MSDRIVVMDNGGFEQIGTPDEVYYHPKTSYVARFVGTANIISGRLERVEDNIACVSVPLRSGGPSFQVPALLSDCQAEWFRQGLMKPGQSVTMAVRSENLILERESGAGLFLPVIEKNFAGGMLRISLDGGDLGELVSSRQGIDSSIQSGDMVTASWKPEHGILVDMEKE